MTLYSKPIKESVNILDENLKEISTVSEWAEFMGIRGVIFLPAFQNVLVKHRWSVSAGLDTSGYRM